MPPQIIYISIVLFDPHNGAVRSILAILSTFTQEETNAQKG